MCECVSALYFCVINVLLMLLLLLFLLLIIAWHEYVYKRGQNMLCVDVALVFGVVVVDFVFVLFHATLLLFVYLSIYMCVCWGFFAVFVFIPSFRSEFDDFVT